MVRMMLLSMLCAAVAMAMWPLRGQERKLGAASPTSTFDPSTLKRFTDGGLYLDKYEMGLYPGGKNDMPEAHRRAGERMAATIRPLDTSSRPDEREGRIWPWCSATPTA